MKLGKYNSITFVILGTILGSALIIAFLIRPAWDKLKTLGTEIPIEQSQLQKLEQDEKNLASAKEFFEKNKSAVQTINTAVPQGAQVPEILAILESLARSNQVFLTSFSPQQATGSTNSTANQAATSSPSGARSIEITANFKGQYSSLINYFYDLESLLRIVDVKTLNVTSSTDSLEGNIIFRAYYNPAEGGTAATPSPAPSPGGTR